MSAEFVKFFLGGLGLLLISIAGAIDWHDDDWLSRSLTIIVFVVAFVAMVLAAIEASGVLAGKP